jgi:hypothetical protein
MVERISMSKLTHNSALSSTSSTAALADGSAVSPVLSHSASAGATATDAPDFGATVTHFLAMAQQFSDAMEQMFAMIPDLQEAHPTNVDFVRGHTTVPVPFLYSMVSLVEEQPDLQAVGKLSAASGRGRLQFMEAFRPVIDKLAVFVDKLRFTVNERRASLTTECLQMYAIIKALARDPGSAELGAYLAILKRDLNRQGPSVESQLKTLGRRNEKRLERRKAEAEKFLAALSKAEQAEAEEPAEKEAA